MNISPLSRTLQAGVATVASLLAAAILAPAAGAAFGLSGVSAAPASTAAGAHSDFSIQIGFTDPSDQVKDLTVHLPPGLIGDPTEPVAGNPPKPCTAAELNQDDCPAATEVGSVTAAVDVHVLDPVVVVPLTINGSIYNLVPHEGEPARFGIVLRPPLSDPLPVLPKIIQQSAVRLRRSDLGLDTVLIDIPHQAAGLETDIKSLDLTLLGTAHGKPFMRNPTSCGAKTTGIDATSYANPGDVVSGQATFTSVDCEALPFTPALDAAITATGSRDAVTFPSLTTIVSQPDEQAGVRKVTVRLPDDIAADGTWITAGSEHICPTTDFVAGTCPPATIAGSAVADSPVLNEPLAGPVAIVEPAAGSVVPRIGLDLRGPLHIQLFGSFEIGGGNPGNTFDDIPDIPLSAFKLDFDADRLVVATRDLCSGEPPAFTVTFEGWNGATAGGDVAADVHGCGGAGAKPTASLGLRNANSAHPKLKLTAKAGSTDLRRLSLKLPKGLRFANGSLFAQGAAGRDDGGALPKSALSHGDRKVTLATSAADGSATLALTVAKHALRRTAHLGGRPHFAVRLVDVDGHATRLSLTPKR